MKAQPFLVLILLLGMGMLPGSSISAQSDHSSISFHPNIAEAPQGSMTSITLGASSSSGGAVLVNIPQGLELIGEPYCYFGCTGLFVSRPDSYTAVEFNIEWQTATIELYLMPSSSSPAGSRYSVIAYLVGGPTAVKQASSTIVVTAPRPTIPAPATDADSGQYGMSITPQTIRSADGGSWVYRIHPTAYAAPATNTVFSLTVTLPSNVHTTSQPVCGPAASIVATHSTCEISESNDGTIQAMIDYQSGPTEVVYIPVEFSSSESQETTHAGDVHMSVNVGTETLYTEQQELIVEVAESVFSLPATGIYPVAYIDIRDPRSLESPGSCGSGYLSDGDQVSITPWGDSGILDAYSSVVFSPITDQDGVFSGTCRAFIRFPSAGGYDFYTIVRGEPIDGHICRACYVGIIPITHLAVPVIEIVIG